MHSLTDELGITAIFADASERQIHAELQALDKNLFLDKEFSHGRVYYVAKEWIGSGHPPVAVVDWRDPDGTPRPLNSGLVAQVRKQGGSAREAVLTASADNAAIRARVRDEREQAWEDAIKENERAMGRLTFGFGKFKVRVPGGNHAGVR